MTRTKTWWMLPLALAACDAGKDGTTDTDTAGDTAETDDTASDTGTDTGADSDDTDVVPTLATCAELGLVPATLSPIPGQRDSFAIRGRFADAAPTLAGQCGPGTAEQVVTFTAPSAGQWELTTDGPATTSDTLLSLRTACDDAAELACEVGGAGLHGARLVVDAAEGEVFEAVIHATDTVARGWQLTARQVTGVAQSGDACDVDISCVGGTTCVGIQTPVCVPMSTPAVTHHDIVWVSNHDARHTLTGTDADADVEQVWLVRALAEDGEIYGDDPGEVPIRLGRDTWTIDPDAGTFEVQIDVSPNLFAFFVTPIVSLDLTIEDAAGNRPTALRASYPTKPTASVAARDEACDAVGFPRACASDSVCIDSGTGGVCIEPTAPVLTAASIAEAADGAHRITVEGTDTTRDARRIRATVDFTDGGTRTYNLYFNDEGTTWNGDAYLAHRTASFYGNSSGPVGVSVEVWDNKSLISESIDLAWPPTPLTVLADGDACDPASDTAQCDEGLVCGPTLFRDMACQVPAPPELYDVRLRYNPTTTWYEAEIDGGDPNGDVYGANFAFTTADYRTLEGIYATSFNPAPVGDDFFVALAYLEDVAPSLYSYVRVELADATGLRSEPILLPLQSLLAQGDSCTPDDLGPLCALDADLACGLGMTCEVADAPVLTSAVAHRLNSGDIQVDIAGTDSNGDALDITTVMIVDGEERPINPPFYRPDPEIYGMTSFSGSLSFGNWATAGDVVEVQVQARDLTDRLSNAITVSVPPLVALGESCSGDDTIDRCEDGSSCDTGVCAQHTPVISQVETVFDNHGRDLLVRIHGADADRVLTEADLTFTGAASDRSENVVIGRTYGLAHDLFWTGDAFLLEVYLPEWGDADDAAHTAVSVTVTDDADIVSAAQSGAVLPTLNLGETCATDGSTDRCQAGLTCTAASCSMDAADPCAGASVIEAATAGTPITDGLRVPLDMTTGSVVAETYCGSTYSRASGTEHVIRYVPNRAGTLTVQSVTPDNDQVFVSVSEGQCITPGAAIGCAKYDSAFTVQAQDGVPLFITVDTNYAHTGAVDLELTWASTP